MRRIKPRTWGPEDDSYGWVEELRAANVPERYWRAKVELIRDADIRAWLEHVLDHPEHWLGPGYGWVLAGPLRSGKSSIAGLMLMDAMRRIERCLWLAVREVPGVMFRDGERNGELHDRLRQADLLVLDDLGSEHYRMDRAGGAALEGCVRTLYDRDRPIIYTTNLGRADLTAAYPKPLISVIRRTSRERVIDTDQWPESPPE